MSKTNNLSLRKFRTGDEYIWDNFAENSLQGSFLYKRKFLSYHGNKFIDHSLIIEKNEEVIGLFPASNDLNDNKCIVSHPGLTYGGIIHNGSLFGEVMILSIKKICNYFYALGKKNIIYKPIPTFYHLSPAQDDLYALFRIKAKRYRCDLSSTIDLQYRSKISKRRQRSLKKAINYGVKIVHGQGYLRQLWPILEENLKSKHNVNPVHTLEQIITLSNIFPDEIMCVCALVDNQVVAGTVLFVMEKVFHAQYIAANKFGHSVSALDAVFDWSIEYASNLGVRWFDFGISTEKQGNILNEGLYKFKCEFGGGGYVHEFYEISLTECNDVTC